jgi:hypothetical protein
MSKSTKTKSQPITVAVLPHLRAAGIKIRIRHKRYCAVPAAWGYNICLTEYSRKQKSGDTEVQPFGGETTVELLYPDAKSYKGVATCSVEDRFDRRKGIEIALKRAVTERKQEKKAVAFGSILTAIEGVLKSGKYSPIE